MLYLNLIWSSYFDYLVYCSDFVMNFAYFFVLVIFLYNLSYMVIDFLYNLYCSGVVFLNCCCCTQFCSVDFDLFSCFDRMIYLVLFLFLRFILIVLLFLSTFRNTMSVSSAINTPFFERWFAFKVWVFFVNIEYFSDFFNEVCI